MSEKVTYKRSDIIDVLRDLNMMIVSLDRIGSDYSIRKSNEEYYKMSSDFLDDWDITRKLAKARQVLESVFSEELDTNGIDELEKEYRNLQFWSPGNPKPKTD